MFELHGRSIIEGEAVGGSGKWFRALNPSEGREVGPEFYAAFIAVEPGYGSFFRPSKRSGHYLFDLPAFLAHRLRRLGLGTVETAPHDTAAEEDLFFSYRRACLRGEPDYGRGLAAIALSE